MLKDTLKNITRAWQGISESLWIDRDRKGEINTTADRKRLRKEIDAWINSGGGEVSARQRAAQLGERYLSLSAEGRRTFLLTLAEEFGPDREEMQSLCASYVGCSDPDQQSSIEEKLREALVSPRLKLLRQFNTLPQGIKFLVDLRASLLTFLNEEPKLLPLDREIRRLLATWFDIGLLEMRQITWDSPAALLEKLVSYEAVHQIHSWQDLRHRLQSDRRCYGFFHPNMEGEPLIFVEVALVNGIAGNIQTLLDDTLPDVDPAKADTAIFYSISNAQQGLKGISFGNFLIKRVVDQLKQELPNIKTFSTLSPIPGFTRWLKGLDANSIREYLLPGEEAVLNSFAEEQGIAEGFAGLFQEQALATSEIPDHVQPVLRGLLLEFFLAKDRRGEPFDPVERFHLGNGARIERINYPGDSSGKGRAQSLGFMVNYLYAISDISKNHERYATDRTIVLSSALKGELKARQQARKAGQAE